VTILFIFLWRNTSILQADIKPYLILKTIIVLPESPNHARDNIQHHYHNGNKRNKYDTSMVRNHIRCGEGPLHNLNISNLVSAVTCFSNKTFLYCMIVVPFCFLLYDITHFTFVSFSCPLTSQTLFFKFSHNVSLASETYSSDSHLKSSAFFSHLSGLSSFVWCK
jgi:hypothetical protein